MNMKQKYFLILGVIVVFGLILISGCTQQKQINFETISKGYYSGHNEKKDYVINSQNEWVKLWNKTMSNQIPLPEVPPVDFSKNTIIAVYQGSHSTGGYSIEITRIIEEDDQVIVYVKESSPSPGAEVTQAFTQPYHIVKTQKITKEIVFKR